MAQRPVLPLGSGLGQIKAPSLQGDANEAAFMNQKGALQKLLGMYPTQAEAIAARKRAQEGIVSMLNQVGGGSTGMGMSDESLNIASSTPQTRSIGSVLSDLLGPSIVDRKLSQASDVIFGAGPKAKPTGVTGGSFAFNELDIFSPDAAAGIAGQRMPLTGGGDQPGDATFGGRIPEDLDAGDDLVETTASIDDKGDVITGTGTVGPRLEDADAADTGIRTRSEDLDSFVAEGVTGSGKTEGAAQDDSTSAKRSNAYEQLLSSALNSYNEAVGRAPSGAKSMAEYKKEFSEATGIDISGDPDNKAALTAFGLALMQNKAGKGFNVGNILSEVGAAGEKALPLMEEARKEARAGQLAAGQYALSEAKSADAARQQFLVDQSNYLTKRRDQILDARVARSEKIEDDAAKREFDRESLAIEYGFKNAIERGKAYETALKAQREGKKVESQYNREPQYTQLKIRLGFTDDGSREIFANPRMDGADVANSYVKLQRSQEAMGRLDALLAEIESAPSPSGQLIMDRGKNVLIALGISDPDQFYKDKGISPEDAANSILNVLIMENKRFATQETGNGISNQDRQDLAESFGQPGQLAANPRAARLKLAELRSIFDAPLAAVEQELSNFYEMKDMYRDENIYNQTISRMDDILNASPYQKIPNEAGDDGVIRFQQGDY